MLNKIKIRSAEEKDLNEILAMIKELAEYEKLSEKVKITLNDLSDAVFGENKFVEVLIAEYQDEICGYTIFFKNYSTFIGKAGYFIEDLYVKPYHRNKGIGKALLNSVIQKAKENNFGRVEWTVLNWNQTAIKFYESIGALQLHDWIIYRPEKDRF